MESKLKRSFWEPQQFRAARNTASTVPHPMRSEQHAPRAAAAVALDSGLLHYEVLPIDL